MACSKIWIQNGRSRKKRTGGILYSELVVACNASQLPGVPLHSFTRVTPYLIEYLRFRRYANECGAFDVC